MKKVTVNGISLAVHDEGSGPPILFVHGFPLSHSMWRAQLDAFATNHRVIAPDLRGFGDSDVTEGTVTMEQHADDLAALLDELHITEPVVLCGLSMGGYIAWQFQQNYSERLRALILCDTRAIADTPEGVENRKRLAKMVVENGSAAVAAAMLPNLFSPVTGKRDQSVIDELRQTIAATSPQGIAAASLGMAERPDVTSLLPSIQTPALLIVGEDDGISTPEEMRTIAAAMPNAAIFEVPNAGHMSPLENPVAVNLVIQQFLDDLPS
ncbi:MAG: alpha/beta fold hydrolase [Planctomycetota bacterium]|nr:alpha/beta fold hydrolase [Planctomycetota bacterium]MDA0919659.1 alpha/beta fold hydrolase [Planctomycetota bacterium]MDA1158098.1 alpha/beta fold hydrolase [Planctomycetota bacterium]